MKKLILLLALGTISHSIVFSQGCLPEGIIFTTQEQIDNFQTNYPGCIELEGDVFIGFWEQSTDIINLNGLNVLKYIDGDLNILWTDNITNLEGINNIKSIGGNFSILGNYALNNFIGLDSLNVIAGMIEIGANHSLTNLIGFENVISIGGDLSVSFNDALINLTGFDNLISVGGNTIRIEENLLLTDILALSQINSNSISNLIIRWNLSLSDCDIQSICELLNNPNCTIEFFENAPGCNSVAEVEAACLTSIEDNFAKDELTLFPNPAFSFITINVNGGQPIEETIIYNHLGQKALEAVPVNNTVDVSTLMPGIYFIEVVTSESRAGTKLVIE
jgi:hypothetical protein